MEIARLPDKVRIGPPSFRKCRWVAVQYSPTWGDALVLVGFEYEEPGTRTIPFKDMFAHIMQLMLTKELADVDIEWVQEELMPLPWSDL